MIRLMTLAVVLLGAFTGISYVVLSQGDVSDYDRLEREDDGEAKLKAYLAEQERASAYAFVRDLLDQRSKEPAIAAVYCRDSWHRWVDGKIEFTGDVDFVDPVGQPFPHRYIATLTGSAKDGWELVTIDVQPDVEEPPRPNPAL